MNDGKLDKVIKGLECCTNISPDGCLMLCPYKDEKDETYSGFCEQVLKQDALALLKEQPEIVRCKDCKYYDHCNGCMSWHDVNSNNDNWYCADGERRDTDD